MKAKLHQYRFELFFISLLLILFGSLLFPLELFDTYFRSFFFLLNVLAGINLLSHKRKLFFLFIGLFFINAIIEISHVLSHKHELFAHNGTSEYFQFFLYFVFYVFVTISIIKQVLEAKCVTKNIIVGLMSGYISLGFIAFFIFMSIEMFHPNSFQGLLLDGASLNSKIDSLIYYSYITLLTIGYGEIIPATPLAQKAAILIGLIGQFYFVILTAVVIEKYIRHNEISK